MRDFRGPLGAKREDEAEFYADGLVLVSPLWDWFLVWRYGVEGIDKLG